ncbi:E3 ubiquitin-protein ligase rpm-1 [Trichinella pseudospiralis]|uniref:RCR-type E3 ubiquitin transferase n=1 Tax=Trichinella pseudospiralis TaxID=6337 RepID=A0A0V1IBI4_TRIPS|nr:E3 ubiquitin-protein ligase rpm-1 [Trichinella pseudospiralis]
MGFVVAFFQFTLIEIFNYKPGQPIFNLSIDIITSRLVLCHSHSNTRTARRRLHICICFFLPTDEKQKFASEKRKTTTLYLHCMGSSDRLTNLASDNQSADNDMLDETRRTRQRLADLIEQSLETPDGCGILYDPRHLLDRRRQADAVPRLQLDELLVPAVPTGLCAYAIARRAVLKRRRAQFEPTSNCKVEPRSVGADRRPRPAKPPRLAKIHLMEMIGIDCLCNLLVELAGPDSADVGAKALTSLYDLLSQLEPGCLAHELPEPQPALDRLFSLLGTPALLLNSNAPLANAAANCLLALAVARGSTASVLNAADFLLRAGQLRPDRAFQRLPENLLPLQQRALDACSRRAGRRCDWNQTDKLTELNRMCRVDAPVDGPVRALASDGRWLYALSGGGLLVKFGSGFGDTIRGLATNCKQTPVRPRGVWSTSLSVADRRLYLRTSGARTRVYSTETLEEQPQNSVHLPSGGNAETAFCSDGSRLYHLAMDDESSCRLTVSSRQLSDSRQYSTARMSWVSLGGEGDGAVIDTALQETAEGEPDEVVDLLPTRQRRFHLSRDGRVWSTVGAGAGHVVERLHADEAICEILAVSVGERDELIAVGHSGAVYATVDQNLTTASTRSSRLTNWTTRVAGPGRVAAYNGTVAWIGLDGRLRLTGRLAGQCALEASAPVAGISQAVAVGVGNSHATVVTATGAIYTFGMNQLDQCGRSAERRLAGRRRSDSSSNGQRVRPPLRLCAADEHVWLREAATVCTACGLCSRLGARCQFNGRPKGSICACGRGPSGCVKCGTCRSCASECQPVSAASATSALPAAALTGSCLTNVRVRAVSCGQYHSLLSTGDGRVLAFGCNRHGQLGVGDTRERRGPVRVNLPTNTKPVVQPAAGANHSVCLTTDGQVYTFGKHDSGQLGRRSTKLGQLWFCTPAPVEAFGSKPGQAFAVRVRASGDQTLVRCRKSLLTVATLRQARLTANKDFFLIFPKPTTKQTADEPQHRYIALDRRRGTVTEVRYNADHGRKAAGQDRCWCLDPLHPVLWCADWNVVDAHVATKAGSGPGTTCGWCPEPTLMKPEFWLPFDRETQVSFQQVALSLLALHRAAVDDDDDDSDRRDRRSEEQDRTQLDHPSDHATTVAVGQVNRFDSFGGGWGYSNQSLDAISYRTDRDVLVHGVGVFGGRGRYNAQLKLVQQQQQQQQQQKAADRQLQDDDEFDYLTLAESETRQFHCSQQQQFQLYFDRPVLCRRQLWYTVCLKIDGPSSDCGANGRSFVKADHGVGFKFRASELSNNGTDVRFGQIPSILYTLLADNDRRLAEEEDVLEHSRPELKLWTSERFLYQANEASLNALLNMLARMEHAALAELTSDRSDSLVEQRWSVERACGAATLCLHQYSLLLTVAYNNAEPCQRAQKQTGSRRPDGEAETNALAPLVERGFKMLFSLVGRFDGRSLIQCQQSLVDQCCRCFVSCFDLFCPSDALTNALTRSALNGQLRGLSAAMLFRALAVRSAPLVRLFTSGHRSDLDNGRNRLADRLAELRSTDASALDRSPLDYCSLIDYCLVNAFAPATRNSSAFDNQLVDDEPTSRLALSTAVSDCLVRLMAELNAATTTDQSTSDGQCCAVRQTPSRFSRLSASPDWNSNAGCADAIAFRVQQPGISVHGAGLFGGPSPLRYCLELLVSRNHHGSDHDQDDSWLLLEQVSGEISPENNMNNNILNMNNYYAGAAHIHHVLLSKSVPMEPTRVYAFRLRVQGGNSWHGEGGQAVVPCGPVRFQYSTCNLSANGTTVNRGQIPTLLYKQQQESVGKQCCNCLERSTAQKWLLVLAEKFSARLANEPAAFNSSLSRHAHLVPLCSNLFGHLHLLVDQHPDVASKLLATFEPLLAQVPVWPMSNANADNPSAQLVDCFGTAVVVESAHPYESAAKVHCQLVEFDSRVQFLCVEFDPKCGTVQPQDSVQIYTKGSQGFYPVLKCTGRCGSSGWPRQVLILPGNQLLVLFETTNVSESTDPSDSGGCSKYGFRCSVHAVGLHIDRNNVEQWLNGELIQLCSYCSAVLVKEVHQIAAVELSASSSSTTAADPNRLLDIDQQQQHQLMQQHHQLLCKGLMMMATADEQTTNSSPVDEEQSLKSKAREKCISKKEKKTNDDDDDDDEQRADGDFVRHFVQGSSSTAAGLLARYLLQDQWYVDVNQCTLTITGCKKSSRSGRTVKVTLTTRDQLGRPVHCPSAEVELTMIREADDYRSRSDVQQPHCPQQQQVPYKPTYVNKVRYMSLTMMPALRDTSAEELRYAHYKNTVHSRTLPVRSNLDGTYESSWMPVQAGLYKLRCKIDEHPLSDMLLLRVDNTGQLLVSTKNTTTTNNNNNDDDDDDDDDDDHYRCCAQQLDKQTSASSNQCRQWKMAMATFPSGQDSSGLRVRAAPSLRADQVGLIPARATLFYVAELTNRDGLWLQLSEESAQTFRDDRRPARSWVMQYHDPLRKQLLVRDFDSTATNPMPIIGQSIDDDGPPASSLTSSSSSRSVVIACEEVYVVRRGSEANGGVAVHVRPDKVSRVLDTVAIGHLLHSVSWIQNSGGIWIQLERKSNSQLRLNSDHGYCMAQELSGEVYLERHWTLDKDPLKIKMTSTTTDEEEQSQRSVPLRPLLVEALRTVFCALLWHERLIGDAVACAVYVQFRRDELPPLSRRRSGPGCVAPPMALQLLRELWHQVQSTVLTVVDKHLIGRPAGATGRCELCDKPVESAIAHMRVEHPGCGRSSQGRGYDRAGHYTTGWTGNCGDGSSTSSAWYLYCERCRSRRLQQLQKSQQPRRLYFDCRAAPVEPERLLRNNARFLLQLNATDLDDDPPLTGEIHSSTGVLVCLSNNNNTTTHANSDPGPSSNVRPAEGQWSSVVESTIARVGGGGGDQSTTDARFLFCPSATLLQLVHRNRAEADLRGSPVLAFCSSRHDVDRLKQSMLMAGRRARLYQRALRTFNRLLSIRPCAPWTASVVWHVIYAMFERDEQPNSIAPLLKHPLREIVYAGRMRAEVVEALHNLLATIGDLLSNCPMEESSRPDAVQLARLCIKAWQVPLSPRDCAVVVSSEVLAAVGRILCWSNDDDDDDDNADHDASERGRVRRAGHLGERVQLQLSSEPALAGSLVDGSADTFWQSGADDHGRPKRLLVRWPSDQVDALLVSLYVDLVRDHQYPVRQVSFYDAVDGRRRRRLKTSLLDGRFVGWVHCAVQGCGLVSVELEGPNANVRLRQLSLVGWPKATEAPVAAEASACPSSGELNLTALQADAVELLRLIAALAFDPSEPPDGQLQQHVLNVLFHPSAGRSATALRFYLCSQLLQALTVEVNTLRGRVKPSFGFVSALVSMLDRIGRQTRAAFHQHRRRSRVLGALAELALFAVAPVQLQAVDTLGVLFQHFDAGRDGAQHALRRLLMLLAKAVQLQVRFKPPARVETLRFNDRPPHAAGWFPERPCSAAASRSVVELFRQLTAGQSGDQWQLSAQTVLAECVAGLVVSAPPAEPVSILHREAFWLAVASLILMSDEQWLHRSQSWRSMVNSARDATVFCDNHDDQSTPASVHCANCHAHYCSQCATVIHLSRRTRRHVLNSLPSAGRVAQVHIREHTKRVRLNWLSLTVDSRALNTLVDFQPTSAKQPTPAGRQCRFCGAPLSASRSPEDVCEREQCSRLVLEACPKMLPCGHLCGGIAGETRCLPCLRCRDGGGSSPLQDAEDLCVICYTDPLGAAPAVQLNCGHVFHHACCVAALSGPSSSNGPRVLFAFMRCPTCRQPMQHDSLRQLLEPHQRLYEEVLQKALTRLQYDRLQRCDELTNANSPFYNQPGLFALDRYAYYLCYKCRRPYFGGLAQCQNDYGQLSDYDERELVCGACSDVQQAKVCPRHGTDFLEYKCRYCCSLAVFFCFGTTHFCTSCHNDFQRLLHLPKEQLPHCPAGPQARQLSGDQCPLNVDHPPTGEEYALGCGICRNIRSF